MEEAVAFMRKEAIKLLLSAAATVILSLTLGQMLSLPPEQCRDCYIGKGLPFPYELSGGIAGQTQFLLPPLIADILVWSCISFLIVFALDHLRKGVSRNTGS